MSRLKKSGPKSNDTPQLWTASGFAIDGEIRFDEPMAEHTTFRAGGPADLFAIPANEDDLRRLLEFVRSESLPCFILGGGANILVSDAGIRGVVIDMGQFCRIGAVMAKDGSSILTAGAGLPISTVSAWAANHGLGGLQFIYSMPGSVAGAVWMNARCYGADIYGALAHVDTLSPGGISSRYQPSPEEFAYKRSPFQGSDTVMTSVGFALKPADSQRLWKEMKEHEDDRRAKGHFSAPSAGSVFKNNRAFGQPTGALIDGLGLRGFQIGGARISDLHANIIVNINQASAAEIRAVIDHMISEVQDKLGFALQTEVLMVGEWEAS